MMEASAVVVFLCNEESEEDCDSNRDYGQNGGNKISKWTYQKKDVFQKHSASEKCPSIALCNPEPQYIEVHRLLSSFITYSAPIVIRLRIFSFSSITLYYAPSALCN